MDETTQAVTEESATSTETTTEESTSAATEESATSKTLETTEEKGPDPESKAVKELKTQREKRRKAEEEAAYWRGVAEGKVKPPDPAPQQDTDARPAITDFETYDDYVAARVKWEIKKEQEQERQKQNVEALQKAHIERMERYAIDDPEIFEIAQDKTLPVSTVMSMVIKESECGPQLIRWLNDNREEAKKIWRMSPFAAAKALGKIEDGIIAPPNPPKPKKVSQAPEPIKPLEPKGPQTIDEDKMSTDDWIKKRNQEARQRR